MSVDRSSESAVGADNRAESEVTEQRIRPLTFDIFTPSDNVWKYKAWKVGEFYRVHGRWPRWGAAGDEGRLAGWLSGQRLAAKGKGNGLWSQDRQAYIDKEAPGWQKTSEEIWRGHADQLGCFYRKHGRWPRRGVAGDEGRLAVWLVGQRTAARGKGKYAWSSQRQSYLDQAAPGWQETLEDTWRSNASLVAVFFHEHGRWPRNKAAGDEGRLAEWLAVQRAAAKGNSKHAWSPQRLSYLDQEAPGWQMSRDDRWRGNADQLGSFYREHGRWPRLGAAGDEGRLGRWLAGQRTTARGKGTYAWSSQRQAYLDAFAPGWEGTGVRGAGFGTASSSGAPTGGRSA